MVNMIGLGMWQLICTLSLVSMIMRIGGRWDILQIGLQTLVLDMMSS